jgi:hypothetical protein
MAKRWRLTVLIVVLASVLAWGWITNERSPSYPGGRFGPAVFQAAVFVGFAWLVVWLWRLIVTRNR